MIERCRGFKDLLPSDMERFRRVEHAFLAASSGWGYREVRTPTIEYLYLFTSVGTLTPGKLRRTYSFLDWDGWSGERVVLKPDATIPVARLYVDGTHEGETARYSYVTSTFMFDESGAKSRQRWQCGAELIGEAGLAGDIELMMVAAETLKLLGVADVSFRLSHSGLISALLESSGLGKDETAQIFDGLLDGNQAQLEVLNRASPEIGRIFSLMFEMSPKSGDFLKNIKSLLNGKAAAESVDNFIRISEAALALGLEFEVSLGAAKGYEYYTGLIFHILSEGKVIGAGGRYDNLVGLLGGKATGAAGFALYMDRVMEAIRPQVETGENTLYLVRSDDPAETLKTAANLRAHNLDIRVIGSVVLPDKGWLVSGISPGLSLVRLSSGEKFQPVSVDRIQEIISRQQNC